MDCIYLHRIKDENSIKKNDIILFFKEILAYQTNKQKKTVI